MEAPSCCPASSALPCSAVHRDAQPKVHKARTCFPAKHPVTPPPHPVTQVLSRVKRQDWQKDADLEPEGGFMHGVRRLSSTAILLYHTTDF